jgi:hypothetical protein
VRALRVQELKRIREYQQVDFIAKNIEEMKLVHVLDAPSFSPAQSS